MDIRGKRVVIIGGSSGFGLAPAKALGAKGARLLLTGRRRGMVEEAAVMLRTSGVDAHALPAHVATEEGGAATMAAAR